ncbi:MAG TPA: Gldg family protein [Stellaceae bacterium]|nr:Gldg family protein [Stellaceae bacterium]
MPRLLDRRGGFEARRARLIGALVCIALMLAAVNVIAARYPTARIDLTAEHLYTLSAGTRLTLSRIDEPVTLRFYYSTQLGDTIPAYGVYAQRVRELLDQYVAAAHGKLRLEIYNPLPFSDVEDRAVALGLQAVPLNSQGEQVYFGLAGSNSTDDTQVIPFFAPERENLLEYDLTRLVHVLAFPKRTVVGLISSLPLDAPAVPGRPARTAAIIDQLRQTDDVEPLAATIDAVPVGTDVLMLVQPQNLPDKTLFAIDQFVLQGGKALVFVDPLSETEARSGRSLSASASDLPRLFKAWGVQLVPGAIAADRRNAQRVYVPNGSGGGAPMDYVAWLNLRGPALNHDDVITAGLRQINLASAGIIEPVAGAATKLEPLIQTSPDSMKLTAEQIAGMPDVAGLLTRFKPDGTRFTLAARITGPAETAFPDGPPKDEAPAQPGAPATPPEFTRKSVKPINVVVVADSDMLDDRLWAQSETFYGKRVVVPSANNADFVANAVDVLAGGEDLIGLRTRGTSARPFDLIEDIQRAADARYAARQATLQQKLKETQAKLRDLTSGQQGNQAGNQTGNQGAASAPLSPAQANAVEAFRADMLLTRQQLRQVQAALRQDIERLKLIVEFCDIALVPLLVTVVAIAAGLVRLRSFRRRRRPATT